MIPTHRLLIWHEKIAMIANQSEYRNAQMVEIPDKYFQIEGLVLVSVISTDYRMHYSKTEGLYSFTSQDSHYSVNSLQAKHISIVSKTIIHCPGISPAAAQDANISER